MHHRPTYRLDLAWAIGDFGLSKATFLIEGDSRRGVLDGTGSGKLDGTGGDGLRFLNGLVAMEVKVTASASFRNLWTTMAQVWLEQVVSRISVVFENAYEVFKQMPQRRHKQSKSRSGLQGHLEELHKDEELCMA